MRGDADVGAGDHTDGMVEVITLLTAVVSAAAAAVSAWVAVAQWRESRAARAARGVVPDDGGSHRDTGAHEEPAGGTGRPGPPEQPAPAGPGAPTGEPTGSHPPTDWVRPRSLDERSARAEPPGPSSPSRTLAVASGIAAVCLALTAAALVGYALEQQDTTTADGPAGTVLSIAMLLSVCGASLAAWVIVTRRSRTARDQRRAALAFAGSLAPWIALTVVDLVRGLAA